MKKYRATQDGMVEGQYVRKGQPVSGLTEENAKPYLKGKAIEEVEVTADGESGGEVFDVAPSLKPSMATETKQVVVEEKSSKAEEKKGAAAAS